jgi:uncharacterized protein YllA (UPF0747 family)
MKNYNKFIFEIMDNGDEHTVNELIREEFLRSEKELLEQLRSGKPLEKDLLEYRNKLNKLAAKTAPFIIEKYDFLETYADEGEVV